MSRIDTTPLPISTDPEYLKRRGTLEVYNRLLAGEKVPIHENEPHTGYYRIWRGEWLPAAIWVANGKLVATIAGKDADPVQIWQSVAKTPVKYEDYAAWAQNGRWPSDPHVASVDQPTQGFFPGLGHNNPPESIEDETAEEKPAEPETSGDQEYDDLRHEIEEVIKAAGKAAAKPPTTQTEADLLTNFKDRLLALSTRAYEAKRKRKAPFEKAAKDLEAFWSPLEDMPKAAVAKLKELIGGWLKAEDARLKREREEREAAARKAAEESGSGLIPAQQQPIQKARAGGASGKRTSLTKKTFAVIEDWKAVAEFFHTNPDVQAVLQKCADKVVAAGGTVPGARAETKDVVR